MSPKLRWNVWLAIETFTPTYSGEYVESEKNSHFRVSVSVIKTVSIREEFKYSAVFIQIQPFFELKEPEISLESANFLESPDLNYPYIFLGVGTPSGQASVNAGRCVDGLVLLSST